MMKNNNEKIKITHHDKSCECSKLLNLGRSQITCKGNRSDIDEFNFLNFKNRYFKFGQKDNTYLA